MSAVLNRVDPVGMPTGAAKGNATKDNTKDKQKVKDKTKDNSKEICQTWNSRKGACAPDGPCRFGRRHVCNYPGCSATHRACDHHGAQSSSEPPAKKRKDNKGNWYKRK